MRPGYGMYRWRLLIAPSLGEWVTTSSQLVLIAPASTQELTENAPPTANADIRREPLKSQDNRQHHQSACAPTDTPSQRHAHKVCSAQSMRPTTASNTQKHMPVACDRQSSLQPEHRQSSGFTIAS